MSDDYGIWMTTEESPARSGWLRKFCRRLAGSRRKAYGRVVAGRYLGDTAPSTRVQPWDDPGADILGDIRRIRDQAAYPPPQPVYFNPWEAELVKAIFGGKLPPGYRLYENDSEGEV